MQDIIDYLAKIDLVDVAFSLLLKLVVAAVIFVVGRWLANLAQKLLEKLLRKRSVDDVLVDFLGAVTNAVIVVVAVVAAIDYLGVPATSLFAVLGAAGLAIGLALKDSLANFAAGVMLVLFRPFTKGDFVEAGGVSGTVEEVFLVSTRLATPDNKEVIVPNAAIWNDSIINYSARDTRRVDMVFGVSYDDDLKVAAQVLRKVCAEHDKVLENPAPAVFVSNLGDSSVDFSVRPWVRTSDYWGVYSAITENAKVALEAAGCSIPYPQRDVHTYIHDDEGSD